LRHKHNERLDTDNHENDDQYSHAAAIDEVGNENISFSRRTSLTDFAPGSADVRWWSSTVSGSSSSSRNICAAAESTGGIKKYSGAAAAAAPTGDDVAMGLLGAHWTR